MFRQKLSGPGFSLLTVLILEHIVEMPVFLCDAELGTRGNTVQLGEYRAQTESREGKFSLLSQDLGVRPWVTE